MLPVVGRAVWRNQSFRFSVLPTACGTLDASAGLIWSNLNDDFVTFCNQSLSINTESTVDFSSNFSVGSMPLTVMEFGH